MLFFIIFEQLSKLSTGSNYEYGKGIIVGAEKDKAKKLNFDLQHLIYDTPQKIIKSGYYYSSVRVVDKEIPESVKLDIASANQFNINMLGGIINVIFFNKDEAYTLLDDYGFISSINVFEHNYNREKVSSIMSEYILYKIAMKDDNGDGRINQDDHEAFYISDNRGKNLRQITPDDLELELFYGPNFDDDVILFEELKEIGVKDQYGFGLRKRRMYTFDFSTLKFSTLDKLESVFQDLQEKYRE
jgi:hypothetical protein